jgi:hypothetical protein
VVAGISPDRRVAVQSERLAKDLDGQRLNVRQLRRRAAQTGLAENLPQPKTQPSRKRRRRRRKKKTTDANTSQAKQQNGKPTGEKPAEAAPEPFAETG